MCKFLNNDIKTILYNNKKIAKKSVYQKNILNLLNIIGNNKLKNKNT